MKKSTIFNVGALVVGLAVVAFLSQGQFVSASNDLTADARDAYTGCLAINYQTGQHAGPRLLMEAYRKCKTEEQAYKFGLTQSGIDEEDAMKVIERVNEATMARHMGVGPSVTRGWGCIRPKKPENFVVS